VPNIEVAQGIVDSHNTKNLPILLDYLKPDNMNASEFKDLNLEDFYATYNIDHSRGFNLTYNNLYEKQLRRSHIESEGAFSRRIFMHMAAVMNILSTSPTHDAAIVVVQK
jgi:hypothetical protein